ncbi:protein phosphatase CheZ [Hirschia baltica]|uniref:Putative chemotaxis phosphatase, CheZ n=1 Tax=Hirschia baltica (strain ATCC 49814 / DSM 5838 / IFAM 1418) TaxID=582402 RepID=C6XQR6_HIRBI|nr:protein phosphatase CheZ [Hirschia baltica]ACT58672.1 putative chemotaxis phosphatase, CheZ [Hirschia baltica ATCC 49814]
MTAAPNEVADRVRGAISSLKKSNVRDRPLVEVLELSHQLADAMKFFFGSLDQTIHGEFKYIADFIHKAKDEISDLCPNEISGERIPGASLELDAVVRDTEAATETIMTEAETLMCADISDPAAYKEQVDAAMMRMIEACSFQDLTGQRVNKVVTTLRHIEERVTAFSTALGVTDSAREETKEEIRDREQLLNGPAIDGPEVAQDDIDAMFAEAPDASQDDIDALFD